MFNKSLFTISLTIFICGCTSTQRNADGDIRGNKTLPQKHVVSIAGDMSLTIREKGALWGTNEIEFTQSSRGTAFAVDVFSKRYLVTAAHVLGINPRTNCLSVDGKLFEFGKGANGLPVIDKQSTHIRIGALALVPLSIRFDFNHDLAIMELTPKDWNKLDDLVIHDLSENSPRVEDRVKMWGFNKDASAQQLKTANVTFATNLIIYVNQPVGGGFSGGPILDNKNCVIGVITRSEPAAALAVPVGFLKSAVAIPACNKDNGKWIVK